MQTIQPSIYTSDFKRIQYKIWSYSVNYKSIIRKFVRFCLYQVTFRSEHKKHRISVFSDENVREPSLYGHYKDEKKMSTSFGLGSSPNNLHGGVKSANA